MGRLRVLAGPRGKAGGGLHRTFPAAEDGSVEVWREIAAAPCFGDVRGSIAEDGQPDTTALKLFQGLKESCIGLKPEVGDPSQEHFQLINAGCRNVAAGDEVSRDLGRGRQMPVVSRLPAVGEHRLGDGRGYAQDCGELGGSSSPFSRTRGCNERAEEIEYHRYRAGSRSRELRWSEVPSSTSPTGCVAIAGMLADKGVNVSG